MKKNYLLIISLVVLFAGSIKAQTYTPFPDSNAVWSVANRNSTHFYTRFYKLFGDTIINFKTYSKLYINHGLIDTVIDMNSPNTIYYGAIRQDTSGKKVYFFPANPLHYSDEFVLYDFSLNVGDSILIPMTNSFFIKAKCLGTTSTMVGGVLRRKIVIEYSKLGGNSYAQWIGGIGDNDGLFAAMNAPLYSTVLLCFTNNDTTINLYNLPFYNFYYSPPFADSSIFHTCSYQGIINPIINVDDLINDSVSKIYISPNPLINSSLISIPEFYQTNNTNIDIYDIQGRLIISIKDMHKPQITLNRTEFDAPGVYFVRIKSDNFLETIKLLVQ